MYADRVVVMDNSHVVLEGTPREVFAQVDTIKAAGLDVPQVTELAYELRKEGIELPEGILTVDEFTEAVAGLYRRKPHVD